MVEVVKMVSTEIAKNICKELINGSLQCQICFGFLFPCWQCLYGHIICWTCHKKDFSCPFCRTDRSEEVLCVAMYAIALKFPVSCVLNCGYVDKPYRMMYHINRCELKLFKCPVDRMDDDTVFRAERRNICDHFLAEHSNFAIRAKSSRFKVRLSHFSLPNSFIECSRECFIINGILIQMWIHVDMRACTLSLALMFYGPEEERLYYRGVITVKSGGTKRFAIVECSPYVESYPEMCGRYKAKFPFHEQSDRFIDEPTVRFEIVENPFRNALQSEVLVDR